MQKLEKSLELSLRYLKTDQRTDNGQGQLLRTPSCKPGVQHHTRASIFQSSEDVKHEFFLCGLMKRYKETS